MTEAAAPQRTAADEVRRVRAVIGGAAVDGEETFRTIDPYRQTPVAEVTQAGGREVAAAVAAARAAAPQVAATPARARAAMLRRAAAAIEARGEALAQIMALETGKAIRDARREVARCPGTLDLCAEEAVRIEGAHIPMDASETGAGKLGVVLRFPLGVVAAITPYNAPLNLVCHKVGPALAAGNAVVLKPAPQASATVAALMEAFREADLPDGWLNTIYGDAAGRLLVEAPGIDAVSFTGSTAVGARIRAAVPLKPVVLELGGNGFTIVHHDADLDAAAGLCASNAMRLAGQSCISVQNVCIARPVFDRFAAQVRAQVARLKAGDPLDEDTDVGPVISASAAEAIAARVEAAAKAGAEILCGGGRRGALVEPTVLRLGAAGGPTFDEEVFGPVMNLVAYDDLAEPVAWVNRGRYGLQAGVFTGSLAVGMQLARSLRVGGVILNGSSTWRSDQAPYGGVKDSGSGREGPRYAIRDMTEERFLVINH
ncbi:aldehyde dehydrogenase family protein [Xanthobacter sp. KR7-225]|uniref:aldehyde dehydrogenase family protein n=1 Tax=Xanthobacter sp. KR7-225 TaxID=3156613 RepID=UPI0032B4E3FD